MISFFICDCCLNLALGKPLYKEHLLVTCSEECFELAKEKDFQYNLQQRMTE